MYKAVLSLLLAGAGSVSADLKVDFNSKASIRSGAKDMAFDVMSYYKGNQSGETPGVFDTPSSSSKYYWWNGAALWSTMLDYWRYTGDATYNTVATEGIVFQIDRQQYPFMSPNWTAGMTTDGHGFWGLVAMSAAELEFPNPAEGNVTWIELAQGVFQALEARYMGETDTCGGGLRAQIPLVNEGYEEKNSLSNGVFLNLAARLARYTGNQTYAEWTDKTWDWLVAVDLIHEYPSFTSIHDFISVANCSDVRTRNHWTIATGAVLEAAAYMYNQTTGETQELWRDRVYKISHADLTSSFAFTHEDERILIEYNCELGWTDRCDEGQQHFYYYKGVYLRQLANTAQLAPFTAKDIARGVSDSAEAAVNVCYGGDSSRGCGYVWNHDPNFEKKRAVVHRDTAADRWGGPPEQMNVLSVLLGLLVDEPARKGFVTNETAGRGEEGNGEGGGEEGNGGQGDEEGNGGQGGSSDGDESEGNGDGGSAGTTTRVAVGWMVAGLAAALF